MTVDKSNELKKPWYLSSADNPAPYISTYLKFRDLTAAASKCGLKERSKFLNGEMASDNEDKAPQSPETAEGSYAVTASAPLAKNCSDPSSAVDASCNSLRSSTAVTSLNLYPAFIPKLPMTKDPSFITL